MNHHRLTELEQRLQNIMEEVSEIERELRSNFDCCAQKHLGNAQSDLSLAAQEVYRESVRRKG